MRPGRRADPARRDRRPAGTRAVAAALLLVLAGCGADQLPTAPNLPASPGPGSTKPTAAVERELATGLDVPWDLAGLPDGSTLVTLRDRAEVVRIASGGEPQVVSRIEEVSPGGEGGLLGIALSPQFTRDNLVYLYYTAVQDNRVIRYRYAASGLTQPTPIVTGIPRAGNHNGGRLRFGPDGYLYIGTGDAGRGELAQDRNSLAGKILRVTADGSYPSDNPFGNAVYSYGHRNVQGLGWDGTGRLFASEFGQNRFDELNLIQPGENYGWPGAEGRTRESGLVSPLLVWEPAEASPSGIAVTPAGTVYVAGLRGQRIWAASWSGTEMTEPEVFLDGLGRIRAVEIVGRELLLLTNNTSRGNPRRGDDRLIAVALR
ncbi:MAG: PQQ-dependent sugar dehydrogenase [Propionibacteriaceae bacterium]|nr:PQQ-dependent sugar dehydrogenase [Propionibacteriaceae bacterium]